MLSAQRIPDDQFRAMRREVLSTWPTGQEVDLDEATEFHKQLGKKNNVCHKLEEAKHNNKILIQPRAGVAPLDANIELLTYLRDEGMADILPSSVDSYTRSNRYQDAQSAIKKSEDEGRSFLNGLPIVNYGVKECRRIIETLGRPLELRSAGEDLRLSAEVAFASGYSAFVHGAICTTMHYSQSQILERGIPLHQYIDRLAGEYTSRGVPILKDMYGLFSNVGVPQGLVFGALILEALLAAHQGVKYIGVNAIMCGNLKQDIASNLAIDELFSSYMKKLGFNDVVIIPIANQWTGPFPDKEADAFSLVVLNTIAAHYGKATEIMVKSVEQGISLPSKEANASALRVTRFTLDMLEHQSTMVDEEVLLEVEMIKKEASLIVDKVLEMGGGDVAQGVYHAFESGMLEGPFSSNKHYSKGKIMVIRDAYGACRYYDFGDLPFTQDIKEYHRDKIRQREELEGRKADFDMITDSILGISKGKLVAQSINEM